jgi:hypothetical protein
MAPTVPIRKSVTLAYAVTQLYAYENEEPGHDEGNDAVA